MHRIFGQMARPSTRIRAFRAAQRRISLRRKILNFRYFRPRLREEEKRSDKFGHSNCVFLRESDKSAKGLFSP
jgi:hypothetical protein